MGIFSGRGDLQDQDPLDDSADFVLTDRQEHIRHLADTRRQMQRVADEIWGSLAQYARTLRYVDRRGRPRAP